MDKLTMKGLYDQFPKYSDKNLQMEVYNNRGEIPWICYCCAKCKICTDQLNPNLNPVFIPKNRETEKSVTSFCPNFELRQSNQQAG